MSTARFSRDGKYVVTLRRRVRPHLAVTDPTGRPPARARAASRERVQPGRHGGRDVGRQERAPQLPSRVPRTTRPGLARRARRSARTRATSSCAASGELDYPREVGLDEGGSLMQGFVQWPSSATGCSPGAGQAVAGRQGGAVIWTRADASFGTSARRPHCGRSGVQPAVAVGRRRHESAATDLGRTNETAVGAPVARAGTPSLFLPRSSFRIRGVLTVDVLGKVRISDPTSRTSVTLPGAAFPAAVSATPDGRIALGTRRACCEFSRRTAASIAEEGDGQGRDASNSVRPAVRSPSAVRQGSEHPGEPARSPGQCCGVQRKDHRYDLQPRRRLRLVTSESTARLWDRSLRRVIVELQAPATFEESSVDGTRIVIAGAKRLGFCPASCVFRGEARGEARSLLRQVDRSCGTPPGCDWCSSGTI